LRVCADEKIVEEQVRGLDDKAVIPVRAYYMPMLGFWIEVRVGEKGGIAVWNCVKGGVYDQSANLQTASKIFR
jgi:hypothetical protein